MLKVLQSFFAIFLALVVLVSTTTITFNKHYCFKRLVKVTITSENTGCDFAESSGKLESCKIEKPDCCSDEQLTIEGIDDLQFEKYTPELDQISLYIPSALISNADFSVYSRLENSSYFKYRPPPLIKSIYRLDEVYLI